MAKPRGPSCWKMARSGRTRVCRETVHQCEFHSTRFLRPSHAQCCPPGWQGLSPFSSLARPAGPLELSGPTVRRACADPEWVLWGLGTAPACAGARGRFAGGAGREAASECLLPHPPWWPLSGLPQLGAPLSPQMLRGSGKGEVCPLGIPRLQLVVEGVGPPGPAWLAGCKELTWGGGRGAGWT